MVPSPKKQMAPIKPFKEQELNKSKGILDDHSIRKSTATREGTITKTPTEDIDIANKKYVDDSAGGVSDHSALNELDYASAAHTGFQPKTKTENYTGADCTGGDGDNNRVLTLANTRLTTSDGFVVHIAGGFHHPILDYTVNHLANNSEITLLGSIWNDQPISVTY